MEIVFYLQYCTFGRTADYASCTALSTFEHDVASVGEDGKLNLLTAAEKKPVRVIGKYCNMKICNLLIYNIHSISF